MKKIITRIDKRCGKKQFDKLSSEQKYLKYMELNVELPKEWSEQLDTDKKELRKEIKSVLFWINCIKNDTSNKKITLDCRIIKNLLKGIDLHISSLGKL